MIRSSLPVKALSSNLSETGSGVAAGSRMAFVFSWSLATSGNGTLFFERIELRRGGGLVMKRGVCGGVMGDLLGLFMTEAPRRWRGVSLAFVENGDGFAPGTLGLTARGIIEGRFESDDAGVGRPWTLVLDLGVAAKLNLSFNFLIGAGAEVVFGGVGGCSSILVKDAEAVRLGAVS